VTDSLRSLAGLAQQVAAEAADHLRSHLGRADLDISSKATDTDLVTQVDRLGEALVVERLLAARPDDGITGEEGTAIVGRSGVEWIVDPLDGTTNFVYGHPGFSVSIAATIDGELAVGVVADPVHDQMFTAWSGGGATCNGRPIRCSDRTTLGRALVATGFAYEPEVRRRQARVLTSVIPHIRDIRRMGGAAVDLCSVACARVDAYYERGLQPWDLAAGTVIAREAGARVGDLDGGPPSAALCIAAPPGLYEPLVELLISAESAPDDHAAGKSAGKLGNPPPIEPSDEAPFLRGNQDPDR
jgi:myo-inositol-1(or 4)-monophosphatase